MRSQRPSLPGWAVSEPSAAERRGGVGTVVIDVDPGGIPAMRRMIADGLLPRTRAQRTGSGYHLAYAKHLNARPGAPRRHRKQRQNPPPAKDPAAHARPPQKTATGPRQLESGGYPAIAPSTGDTGERIVRVR